MKTPCRIVDGRASGRGQPTPPDPGAIAEDLTLRAYQEFLPRFKKAVCGVVPPNASVVVVSKGDPALLELDDRAGWHFPRRHDGVYAGYYPADSAAAIAHLDALRRKGAEFLVFPQSAFWWLEHYAGFRQHLESTCAVLLHQEDTCLIFKLNGNPPGKEMSDSAPIALVSPDGDTLAPAQGTSGNGCARHKNSATDSIDNRFSDEVHVLFDFDYYKSQAGDFPSAEAAIIHYLGTGFAEGYSPHPLFDPAYYVSKCPQCRAALMNPLLHFLTHSASQSQDPGPYFDTEFYYLQRPPLRTQGVNALVHYVTHVGQGRANRPNPLFGNAYYLDTYQDVKQAGLNPLAHFISTGCAEGRFASAIHREMIGTLLGRSKKHLLRGNWRSDNVLLFAEGADRDETLKALKIAAILGEKFHLRCMVVLSRRHGSFGSDLDDENVVVLEDYLLAGDVLRPSAIRLLAKSLEALNPLFAISTAPDLLDALHAEGIPAVFLADGRTAECSRQTLQSACSQALRVVFDSSDAFHSAGHCLGYYPTNVARRPYREESSADYVASLLGLAGRDIQLPDGLCAFQERRRATQTNKVIIPCCDWALSGVNSAVEAIGQELVRLGWDVEVLFTRDPARTAGDAAILPELPYRYLRPRMPGLDGMWEALIADLENIAPCIMLMAYDFAANGVASALTEKVGAVAWIQSDDKDYYEQVYRLGRYCNAVVCVSEHIKHAVAKLNPLIGAKCEVIHNSSIWEKEIAEKKPPRSKRMRLIYTGRLVQYQKRILDILDLAAGFDRLAVPYQITLVGEFSPREGTEEVFRRKAQAHLADGRIILRGRMRREQVLKELGKHDFFALLSDFEGMPLSLVEAMARGCVPVVAAIDSGIPEAVVNDRNGLVIVGRDYEDWARRLVKWWRNPKCLAKMSQQARRTVQQQFTVERIGRQFSELFTRVAKQICSGEYARPGCLNWGPARSPTGDVLPPPSMLRPPVYHRCVGP